MGLGSAEPLKILMMVDMPWDRNLGGPRAQIVLADEFRKKGHVVEKFDYYDAFPQARASQIAKPEQLSISSKVKYEYGRFKALSRTLARPNFSIKAKAFITKNSDCFDIIDARESNLPFTKKELKFNGLLVARSVGLYAHHQQFFNFEKVKWPSADQGNVVAKHLRSWRQKKLDPDYPRSLEMCDLINVPNNDEFAYIRDEMHLGDKCIVLPYGLTQKQQESFTPDTQSIAERFSRKLIVFIGRWGTGKGSLDWVKIINGVRSRVPEAQFLFLGTSHNSERVLNDLNMPACTWLNIIPHYDNENLPEFLSKATVAAFPSYIEGFPYAVLEKLACGLPTVAYDVPGPREMLRHLRTNLMVPAGDTERFSNELVKLLKLEQSSYTQLSRECVEVAHKFSWSKIAEDTLDIYGEVLNSLKAG